MAYMISDKEIKNLDFCMNKCHEDGLIKPKKKIDLDLTESLISNSDSAKQRIMMSGHSYEEKTGNYGFLLRDRYEILRMLIDALLLFDRVNISNHQCSNAYLCIKHPELRLDWKVIETMRMLRNDVCYEGKKISKECWNSLKSYFDLYSSILREEVVKRLKQHRRV
jgi:hypothetical protein